MPWGRRIQKTLKRQSTYKVHKKTTNKRPCTNNKQDFNNDHHQIRSMLNVGISHKNNLSLHNKGKFLYLLE